VPTFTKPAFSPKAQSAAKQRDDEAQAAVRSAEQNQQYKIAATEAFSPTDTRKAAVDARKEALVAAEAVKKAKENAGKVAEETAKVTGDAQNQFDAAGVTKEKVAIDRQTFRTQRNSTEQTRYDELQAKGKDLYTQIDNTPEGEREPLIAAYKQNNSALAAQKRRLADNPAVPPESKTSSPGTGGTIEKAGETIKVTGANTVAQLKKLGDASVDSAKAMEKATADAAKRVADASPIIIKAVYANAEALAKYNSSLVGALQAQAARTEALAQQVDQLKRANTAKADRS